MSRNYLQIAEQYCADVLSGKRVAGKLEKGAVNRFLSDIKRQTNDVAFDYRLDMDRATHACHFIETLHHVKGKLARTNFIMEPWQVFVVVNLFGWVDSSDIRRFTHAYIEIAKKNGKSTFAAAIGLYMLVADGEEGAEVYAAATNYDQAKIVWADAKQMVNINKPLQQRFGVGFTQYEIRVPDKNSVFMPLATDKEGSKDGKNVHCGILDEIHAHKDSQTYDIISDGIVSREEPLILGITTAGNNRTGVCWRERSTVVGILLKKIKLERYFGIIFTLDNRDDWRDPKNWPKANPSMGVSFNQNYLMDKYKKVLETPSQEPMFRQKSLSQWVGAADGWIPNAVWDKCFSPNMPRYSFTTAPKFGGGDLASKLDLAGFVTLEPQLIDGVVHWYAFCKQYINSKVVNSTKAINGEKRPDDYINWEREGWLIVTEGNTTDFNKIQSDVIASHHENPFYEFGFDSFKADQFGQNLIEAEINAVEIPQRVNPLDAAMRWIEVLIAEGRLHHNGDPVLAWGVTNIVVAPDNNNNIFPRKSNPEMKIDPGLGLINAAARAMFHDTPDVMDLVPEVDDFDFDDYIANMVTARRK